MLEILAVRLLAPYVGLTLETTTAIIGAALAGIAVGAAIGGYLADRTDTRKLVVGAADRRGAADGADGAGGALAGPGARGEGELAALGITVVALVPAAAALSAVSPAIAHLQLHNLQRQRDGRRPPLRLGNGRRLVGTFGTGFVLVPLMPVSTAVIVIGAVAGRGGHRSWRPGAG